MENRIEVTDMSYIIVQDSRKNKGRNLALVDRSKKQDGWWTSVLENALVFKNKEEANERASKYKFNNPRVVPFDEALSIITPIITFTFSKLNKGITKNIFEMSDWEYKEWLGYSDVVEQGGGMFE